MLKLGGSMYLNLWRTLFSTFLPTTQTESIWLRWSFCYCTAIDYNYINYKTTFFSFGLLDKYLINKGGLYCAELSLYAIGISYAEPPATSKDR